MRNLLSASAAAAVVLNVSLAFAHHSFAAYDSTRTITVKGTISEFRWINPHAILVVRADSSQGGATWAIELSSPGNLTRSGWTRSLVRAGDVVEVIAQPLRDGSTGAACQKVRLVQTDKSFDCGAAAAIHLGEKPNLQ